MKKIERNNRQRGSETIDIGIEIERWGMGCADKGPRSSLIIEKSSRKQKRQSTLSQHSSAASERIHPGETKLNFQQKPPSQATEQKTGHVTNHTTLSSPHQTKNHPFPIATAKQTSLTTMRAQTPPAAAVSKVNASTQPRRSERSRKATTRLVQGWYGERLPRLSAALGVARSDNGRGNSVGGGEASSSDGWQSSGLGVEDEGQRLGVMIEEEEEEVAAMCSAPEPRRSERERRATKRFEEGWFRGRLPRLGLALGVKVSGRLDR